MMGQSSAERSCLEEIAATVPGGRLADQASALGGRHQAAKAPKTVTRWSRLRSDSRPAEAIPSIFPKLTLPGSSAAHEAADRRAAGGKGRLAAAAAGAVEVLAA